MKLAIKKYNIIIYSVPRLSATVVSIRTTLANVITIINTV